jgi:hypothetical protein
MICLETKPQLRLPVCMWILYFFEMRSCCVAQDGFELYLPGSDFGMAGVIGMHDHAQQDSAGIRAKKFNIGPTLLSNKGPIFEVSLVVTNRAIFMAIFVSGPGSN